MKDEQELGYANIEKLAVGTAAAAAQVTTSKEESAANERQAPDTVNLPSSSQVTATEVLILLKSGNEDHGRQASIAFAVGVAAIFSECTTTMFFLGNGVNWAYKHAMENITIKGYEPLSTYFNTFVMNGGHVLASTPCLQYNRSVDQFLRRKDILANVDCVGLTTLVELARKATVLTF